MRAILRNLASRRIRSSVHKKRQMALVRSLPDHVLRDIGLPERGSDAALSRQYHNPFGW